MVSTDSFGQISSDFPYHGVYFSV